MKNKKALMNRIIILGQILAILSVFIFVYFYYPKVNLNVNGDSVRFSSVNANVIIISENPDFTNPKYLDLTELNNISFRLEPGKYYWKADNGLISGFKKEMVIDSEVGLGINRDDEANLVNIGNVKLNVTKEGGTMVGHIILSPEENEKIEDEGIYSGRQLK